METIGKVEGSGFRGSFWEQEGLETLSPKVMVSTIKATPLRL